MNTAGIIFASQTISLERLAIGLIPAVVVLVILNVWKIRTWTSIYALFRMLVQLLIIGYVLHFIFAAEQAWIIVSVLCMMLGAASWISLRVATAERPRLFKYAISAIALGGGLTLVVITQGVLQLDPWYEPQKLIPLAGMIFSNSMNAVSLALDRCQSQLRQDISYDVARRTALEASLIPITNSLFAVGLVAIPGMMTGQVLAGIEPAIAARYQIMVMCMMFGSAGMSSALFLTFAGESNIRPTDDSAAET